jgi:hypothetical protein
VVGRRDETPCVLYVGVSSKRPGKQQRRVSYQGEAIRVLFGCGQIEEQFGLGAARPARV